MPHAEPKLYYFRLQAPLSHREFDRTIVHIVSDEKHMMAAIEQAHKAFVQMPDVQAVSAEDFKAACGIEVITTSDVVELRQKRRA